MINFVRLCFASLIGFEALNWKGILPFKLDFAWPGLIGTAFLLWLALEICNKFYKPVPWFLYFGIMSETTLDASSDIFHFYSQIVWWDELMHFAGGAVAALIIIYIFKQSYFYSLLWVNLLGVMYEYWEFLIDKFYFGYSKALGNGPDTVDDLLFNIIGVVSIILLLKLINYVKINYGK